MSQNLEQSLSDQSGVYSSSLTAGAMLSAQRQHLGLSLEDVAGKLKLAKRQVEALEADRFDALPGNTFVRGFVRNYARLLEIDPQPLLDDLAKHLPPEAVQAALPRLHDDAMPMLRPRTGSKGSPFFIALVIALLLVLGLAAVWFYFNGKHEPILTFGGAFSSGETAPAVATQPASATPTPVEMPAPAATAGQDAALPAPTVNPADALATNTANTAATPAAASVPATTPAAPVVPSTPASVVAPVSAEVKPAVVESKPIVEPKPAADAKPAASGGNDITVVAKQDAWVQIVDASGKRLVGELVKAGDRRTVTGKAPYQVRIGNAQHAELYYHGQQTDLTSYIRVDVANIELK